MRTASVSPSGSGPPPGGRAPDVLVVGGGVIGLVTAWRAAGRGLRVAVVDPDPGGGAARVAAGMLAPVTELHHGEEALLRLNLASAARYPEFAAELAEATGLGIGYRECGTLQVALDADDRAQLRELHALQRRCGLAAEWLTGRECRSLEPMLAPAVQGGLRVEGDHQADPRLLVAALLAACERAGVLFHRAWARALTVAGGRATGVLLDGGEALAAGQCVLAAGWRSGELAGIPAAAVPPVRPVKGQILRLRMPAARPGQAPFLSRTVRAVVRGGQVYLVPRASGELVLGATVEEHGRDAGVTAGGVYRLLRDAHELLPGLTELPLAETGSGLRPATPDNGPLLGPSALPGLQLATGHHRNGVLLAPLTGEALAESLTGGELPTYAREFHARRFEHAHREAAV
ncbi:glycine oxidase ThiO [Streptomyces hoynatensis]|uniref:glycine oxidase n=1 Tax=Streptomyces hoynatensis TaxID=1141874 RepID=A0A3A9Z4H0_9ACTN|nr:glycine oxidase ThiO [Streptomyces hoynatensis]RKN42286.1 glycine oxidase ThiO [Streptomyces hoynatensis]